MQYKRLGERDVEISVVALGGHEYLGDGSSRGFNEDFARAVTPGEFLEGFGGPKRKEVLAAAFELGINFLDVTIDAEKEALGRNLQEVVPPYEVYIQTRPEGMVYTYDEYNAKMANYDLLRAEVQRILKLLRRDRIDFFNIAFMKSALEHDPEYLDKIKSNVEALKGEGLIRFACADTFSGEEIYLKQIATGCFDAVYVNLGLANSAALKNVFGAAAQRKMGVFTREVLTKGELFAMGEEVGLTDRSELARTALKWNLSHEDVTMAVIGVDNADQLRANLDILDGVELNDRDREIIETLKLSGKFKEYSERRARGFLGR